MPGIRGERRLSGTRFHAGVPRTGRRRLGSRYHVWSRRALVEATFQGGQVAGRIVNLAFEPGRGMRFVSGFQRIQLIGELSCSAVSRPEAHWHGFRRA